MGQESQLNPGRDMAYRVLAYGGTSYNERLRVGMWNVDAGILGAREGLEDGESFGLGVLGAEPHVVFRQLQNVESRGGYPYTLLFDPGREVWHSFGWNAAAIVRLLKRYDGLFTEPEAFAIERMTFEPSAVATIEKPSRLRLLLAGSLVSETPVVVHPRDAGFSGRPSPEELCKVLALDVQRSGVPCFGFTGLGWLVGAGRVVAERLGAKLAIDEESLTDPTTVASIARAGEQLLDDWQVIEKWNPAVLSLMRQQPPWEWSASAHEIASRIGWLAALLSSLPADADRVFAEIDLPAAGGPLVTELRAVAREAAQSGKRSLSSERARFLLMDAIRVHEQLAADLIERMPNQIVVTTLLSACVAPDELPESLEIPLPLLVEIWRESLVRSAEPDKLALLARSAEHLRNRKGISASSYQTLVDTAITDSADLRSSDLARVRSDRKFKAAINKRLAPRVRRTLLQSDYARHTEDQFLYLDDDDIVQEVNRSSNPRERATEIVNAWFLHLRDHPEAAERFDRLATSPLRALLKNHVKLQVAQANEEADMYSGPWGHYLYMDHLYSGGEAVNAKTVDDQDEKARLYVELRELFSLPRPTKTPNLVALAQFLDPIPQEVREQVARKANQPDPEAPGFDGWQRGLELLGLAEARGGNLLSRLWRWSPLSRPSGGRASLETDARRAEIAPGDLAAFNAAWRRLLFAPVDDADLADLDKFLRVGRSVPEFASFVQAALSSAALVEQRTFGERFFEPDRLDCLLSAVTDEAIQDEIVDLVALDLVRFREPHQERLSRALHRAKSDEPCGSLDKALARFLQRHPEEMSRWGKTLYGNVNTFQQDLKHLIELPAAGPDDQP